MTAGSLCLAQNIQYNVVVTPDIEDATVCVAVGQDVYPLKLSETVPYFYSGYAPGQKEYRYTILNGTLDVHHYEDFERPAIMEAASTFNEVYDRSWNKLDLPDLPTVYSYDDYGTARPIPGESALYEDGHIANLFFEGDAEDLFEIHDNKMNNSLRVWGNLTYISYNHIEQFEGVVLKVTGHNSRKWAKVPYKVKIPQSDYPNGLFRRWSLKLRPEATDITLLREKVYADVIAAAGVIGPRGSYTRFYQETFHDGDSSVNTGVIIKADGGRGAYPADMDYHGDKPSDYDPNVYRCAEEGSSGSQDLLKPFIDLLKYVNEYTREKKVSEDDAIAKWNTYLDVKHLSRQLALEWLTGNWDGVQYAGNNYMIYYHPSMKRHVFIPMDFDSSFGNGIMEDKEKLIGGKWTDFTSGRRIHNFLWEKLATVPKIQKMYMDEMYDMNERLMRPDVIMPRIEALAYMIEADALWDRSIAPYTVGMARHWPENGQYFSTLEVGSGEPDEPYSLKYWIREKYQVVHVDYATYTILDEESIDNLIQSNAIDMKGVMPAQQVNLTRPIKVAKVGDI
ncbi:hypothetical protein DM01DRAFT_1389469 [Hesseltinella vesiculosa]|uniref:Coth-domain-containing protein n=1 Tax=Hesseltinella vesiculosa TaxID=101127 RepID=A0A1X2GK44_9FUNG|nr:hypothetical protein DM01DRAFT_1389469 [Hesseltinella vesiculosa]